MATNDMYRQLLSQAVSRNGSALIGGNSRGGAMIGGAYYKPTNRKSTMSSQYDSDDENSIATRAYKSRQARERFQDPEVKEKAKVARKFRKNFIDNELLNVYGGRSKISFNERADAINNAKKQLHLMKTQKAEEKRNGRSDAEKKADARKSAESRARTLEKHGFEDTKEGRKAFRIAKGYEKQKKSSTQKRKDKLVRDDPNVRAAIAAARSRINL